MKIPRNISSELPRIGPSESPSKYPEEVLPRYIPTNWWSSEFPRKFISSEFRRKFPRDFRGKMNFRGVISDNLFRRYVVGVTLFRRHTDDFFPRFANCEIRTVVIVDKRRLIGYRDAREAGDERSSGERKSPSATETRRSTPC
ncbi:hypothetical protein DY000_02044877 [Brassica cretica]|uniref:Uncharacterized protein n=1 Tax=Brassica cretica TaxID=69181 RepID=A0ABQ7ESM5_BRACR|nr:hypothetical protein DY000_02044877 [Brassica cretica]